MTGLDYKIGQNSLKIYKEKRIPEYCRNLGLSPNRTSQQAPIIPHFQHFLQWRSKTNCDSLRLSLCSSPSGTCAIFWLSITTTHYCWSSLHVKLASEVFSWKHWQKLPNDMMKYWSATPSVFEHDRTASQRACRELLWTWCRFNLGSNWKSLPPRVQSRSGQRLNLMSTER